MSEHGTPWGEWAQLASDTIAMKPVKGIPAGTVFAMDVPFMEQTAGHRPGDYANDPVGIYVAFQKLAGTCFVDQFIPTNPLSMGAHGYISSTPKGATTGLDSILCDGMEIDSPEAVIEHLEKIIFPRRQQEIADWPAKEQAFVDRIISEERQVQETLGRNILKGPYFFAFPYLSYGTYGYTNYFMAYALYPEVMARDFATQADLATLKNHAIAKAIVQAHLPHLLRLDHDMADGRGTLVDVKSLDAIWFPHFERSIQPLLKAGIRLTWHCDGNLMAMVPRLIGCGVSGFQGFQYEYGMDYEKICRMKDRNGNSLLIIAGVSVTRTLPWGRPDDVRREMKWLVENGPAVGLFLGASSSITPGVPHENLHAFIEGLHYYRNAGRGQA